MPNFRLKVFYSAATHGNFTKAAEEMCITQPAVTKNIKELETELDIKLFDRKAGKVVLTKAGKIVFSYAQNMLNLNTQLAFDLSQLKKQYAGNLRLGASTTIGQYILPPLLAKFSEKFSQIKLELLNKNTQQIEQALLANEIDLGIVEGISKHSGIKYIPYMKDEIVLVAHTSQPYAKKDEISIDELLNTPLVLREVGSGSLDVILNQLKKQNIHIQDLNIVMHLGSTESIKTYLANSNTLGLISISAITKEIKNGEFKIIDIKGISFERLFYIIHTFGKPSGFADMFILFLQNTITNGYSL